MSGSKYAELKVPVAVGLVLLTTSFLGCKNLAAENIKDSLLGTQHNLE